MRLLLVNNGDVPINAVKHGAVHLMFSEILAWTIAESKGVLDVIMDNEMIKPYNRNTSGA